jgi:hypothetical protein
METKCSPPYLEELVNDSCPQPVHNLQFDSVKIDFNISFPSMPRSPEWYFPLRVSNQIIAHLTLYSPPMSCSLIYQSYNTRRRVQVWSSPASSFRPPPATSSLSSPNSLLTTLFSKALNCRLSLT